MIVVTITYVCDRCLAVSGTAQLAYPLDEFTATPPEGWAFTTPRFDVLCDSCQEEEGREEEPDGDS